MKKFASIFLIMITVGILPWGGAQTTQTSLFDSRKAQQELEIMKGILGTTLNFILRDIRSRSDSEKTASQEFLGQSWGTPNIGAYYLYGQGATFVIPLSSLRSALRHGGRFAYAMGPEGKLAGLNVMSLDMALADADEKMAAAGMSLDATREEMEHLAQEQAEAAQAMTGLALAGQASGTGTGSGTGAGVGSGKAQTGTPAPAQASAPAKPATPVPPKAATAPRAKENQEVLKKKLFDAQERVKKRREEIEVLQKKFMESLGEIKGYLMEALANHGDSLTLLKPNEYINIILTNDDGGGFLISSGEDRTHREIMSVQKSVIAEYKAGRITLDQFKQKVLQYTN